MPKYLNDEYDVEKAFRAIEDELISSMIRNLDGHRAEETDEGYNWTQWQVDQINSLEKYKRENQDRFTSDFSNIHASIGAMIREARAAGETDQEQKILRAIKNGFKTAKRPEKGIESAFFRLNTRKLDALIKATTDDFTKAEHAMLRMANDKYRKIIFNAQVYANTGAATYEKAVDMATSDFISSGINCIEYKNGARHTLKEYSKMAIQTANKRAYLTGEGEKRQEYGISTVIMNKRGNACPKCLPFVGKILIDDVWSGGKASDGPYPLMSTAIEAGLYHPRCKDSHTTYFPELDDEPEETYTSKELKQVEEDYKTDQEQQYAQRQAEKYDRLQRYSLDSGNKKIYGSRAENWKNKSTGIKGDKSGIIKPSKVVEGHISMPKMAEPNDIIDHINEKGKVDVRAFHDETGLKKKDIHTDDHGNPKHHNFGIHGEHGHDFEWNEDGSLKEKTTRELTDLERKENGDIL